jgi:hypothetical protein
MGHNGPKDKRSDDEERNQLYFYRPAEGENSALAKSKPDYRRKDAEGPHRYPEFLIPAHSELPIPNLIRAGFRNRFWAIKLLHPGKPQAHILLKRKTATCWCTGKDSNLRSPKGRQIYSLLPLTTRPPVPIFSSASEVRLWRIPPSPDVSGSSGSPDMWSDASGDLPRRTGSIFSYLPEISSVSNDQTIQNKYSNNSSSPSLPSGRVLTLRRGLRAAMRGAGEGI